MKRRQLPGHPQLRVDQRQPQRAQPSLRRPMDGPSHRAVLEKQLQRYLLLHAFSAAPDSPATTTPKTEGFEPQTSSSDSSAPDGADSTPEQD